MVLLNKSGVKRYFNNKDRKVGDRGVEVLDLIVQGLFDRVIDEVKTFRMYSRAELLMYGLREGYITRETILKTEKEVSG